MWIFGTDWFVSVVAHRTEPDMVLVRARLHDDLKRFLRLGYSKKKMPKIWADKNADYRFRALVPQAAVADMAQKAVKRSITTTSRTKPASDPRSTTRVLSVAGHCTASGTLCLTYRSRVLALTTA